MNRHQKEVIKDLGEIREDLNEIKKDRGPWFAILSLFLILILLVTLVPVYYVKIDPRPRDVPSIDEVLPENTSQLIIENVLYNISSKQDYLLIVDYEDNLIKQTATKIAVQSCDSGKVCQAKAIFEFVRDNIKYVSEADEYIETPAEVLITGGADCDGHSILTASLMQSIGIPTRFVFIPGHVFVQVYLEDAMEKYKADYHWINVDPTCSYCDFGEIPKDNSEYEFFVVG